MMLKGFNSDISVGSQSYHVQSEDWGAEKQLLTTTVFKNGAVIKRLKLHYTEVLERVPFLNQEDALLMALKRQHYQVLDQLSRGDLSAESL
jgi:hypothetical protein